MERKYFDELVLRYPVLAGLRFEIDTTYDILSSCYRRGGTIFIAGNGGSKADADHIAGELLKGFLKKRPLSSAAKKTFRKYAGGMELADMLQEGIPAVSLGNGALSTAIINDIGGDYIFAQQLYAIGCEYDVLIGISK
jgi:D-sedoheptulose 7-phosphate isomerase